MGIASDTYAQMTRDMWAAWVRNFMPIENTLIDYSMDVSAPGAQAESAVQSVRQAFAGAKQRKARGIEVPLSADEAAAAERASALQQSLAEVGAANAARMATVHRQRGILGAPMPQPEQFQLPVGR